MERFQLVPHGVLVGERVYVEMFPCARRAFEAVVTSRVARFFAPEIIERNAAKAHQLPQVAHGCLLCLRVGRSEGGRSVLHTGKVNRMILLYPFCVMSQIQKIVFWPRHPTGQAIRLAVCLLDPESRFRMTIDE